MPLFLSEKRVGLSDRQVLKYWTDARNSSPTSNFLKLDASDLGVLC